MENVELEGGHLSESECLLVLQVAKTAFMRYPEDLEAAMMAVWAVDFVGSQLYLEEEELLETTPLEGRTIEERQEMIGLAREADNNDQAAATKLQIMLAGN